MTSPTETLIRALAKAIAHMENGEDHNEGAFDDSCDTCVLLSELREALAAAQDQGQSWWQVGNESAAKCAEQEIDRYYEGMSAIDVRLSNRRGPRWHEGPAIAKAIRALPPPPLIREVTK